MHLDCGAQGLGVDPRLIKTTLRLKDKLIHVAGVYLEVGAGPNAKNIDIISRASVVGDKGRDCVIIIGDFNVPASRLKESGILDKLGLEVFAPSNGDTIGTQGK